MNDFSFEWLVTPNIYFILEWVWIVDMISYLVKPYKHCDIIIKTGGGGGGTLTYLTYIGNTGMRCCDDTLFQNSISVL